MMCSKSYEYIGAFYSFNEDFIGESQLSEGEQKLQFYDHGKDLSSALGPISL
jgi:hypothetical protein